MIESKLAVTIFLIVLLIPLSPCPLADTPQPLVVGTLKTRSYLLELHSGANGALYTVKNLHGKTLASNLNEKGLVAQFPELESIISGYADDASLGPKTNNPELFDGLAPQQASHARH
ncbi:MAG: hypothetical protein ACI9Y1_001814 [Lentisphaeria bacterium]|jgi:hypothetical protein